MIDIIHNKLTLSYDTEKNEIYVNGELDKAKRYSPSFIDNQDGTVTFIGITDNKTNEFISMTGKVMEVIKPEDIKL